MGKLGNISGKEAARAFQKAGWEIVGQIGSHVVMSKRGVRANLSIPQHKDLSVGTLRALIRHTGLTVDAYNCCDAVIRQVIAEHYRQRGA